MAVWRDGVTGALGDAGCGYDRCDLDNADALPTYPQPQPQQQKKVLVA